MRNHSPIDRLLTLAVVAALTVAFPHATARADVGVAIDVAGARGGLARLLDNTPDTGPFEPLDECSIVARSTFNDALATAGVDAPVREWTIEVGPIDTGPASSDARGLTCAGSHVGADDESFPELRASLVVVDLGDSGAFEVFLADTLTGDADPLPTPAIGGGTRGECADVDRTDHCVEFWEEDGFVVGVTLADRVFMDRPTASAILVDVVPAVVATLAAGSSLSGDPFADVTDQQVEAAAAGLPAALRTLPEAPERAPACPVIDREVALELLEVADVGITFEAWAGSRIEVYADDEAPLVPGLLCDGGAPDALVTFLVVDFDRPALADEYVASLGLPEGGSPTDLVPGEATVGYCSSVSGVRYCAEFWRGGGLVIGVTLYRETGSIGDRAAPAILAGIVPEILGRLAG